MRTATREIRASDGNEHSVADFLQAHASRSRTPEEERIDFQIARDSEMSQAFFIITLHRTAGGQASHRETGHFKRFLDECVPVLEDAPDGTEFFARRLLDRFAQVGRLFSTAGSLRGPWRVGVHADRRLYCPESHAARRSYRTDAVVERLLVRFGRFGEHSATVSLDGRSFPHVSFPSSSRKAVM